TTGKVTLLTGEDAFGVSLSDQVQWIGQGPIQTTGGQVMGLDDQGKAVSGAIIAAAIDPSDPNVVYVATANGGIWKTTNINVTRQTDFVDPAKGAGPEVANTGYRVGGSFEFTAVIDPGPGNDLNATVAAATFSNVTSGGAAAVKATGTFGTAGTNAIKLTAEN